MSDSAVTLVPEDWRSESQTVVSRTSFLFNSPELSDIQFIFTVTENEDRKETTIYGHKLILAMASPVFNKMFFGQNQQFTTTVESRMDMNHHTFNAESFLTFIKFLYIDKVNYEGLSVEVIIGILNCADFYNVPYLKMDCAKQLGKILTTKNVIQALETAVLFREDDLTLKAFEFIDQNLGSVVEAGEILRIKLETLFEIVKRDSLDIDECFVLDLALKWAEEECKRNSRKPTAKTKREVLGKVFFEIRFGLLTSDRIAELVSSNLMSAREALDVVLEIHNPGYEITAGNSKSKRLRLAPEVGFKSNPRIFGQKKKSMEVLEMKTKLRKDNISDYLKAMSLATGRVDLNMRGFSISKTSVELKVEIGTVRSVFYLEVYPRGPGAFRVKFKYNLSQYLRIDLVDPAWYEFDNPTSIHISERGDENE